MTDAIRQTLLAFNVASQCGLTPQYKGLQKLYEEFGKDGLVIVGVPANEFGKQEPGTNDEIKTFCEGAFNVTFTQSTLTAPAGRPFTVAFDNRDNVPHNLEVRDAAGKSLFVGDIITGPKVIVYTVPALAAGQYPFVCTVHPGMIGTLTVK